MKMFYTPPWFAKVGQGLDDTNREHRPWSRSQYRRNREVVSPAGICPGCGDRFPVMDGPIHAYLAVSPGCWAQVGESLALHYSDHRYWPAHQLLTDTYALQHSQGNDRRSSRSVHVHLAALYAQLRLDQAEARVIALRGALAEFDFNPLSQDWPEPSTSINTVDRSEPELHLSTVRDYARAVLDDWSPFHGLAEKLCRI